MLINARLASETLTYRRNIIKSYFIASSAAEAAKRSAFGGAIFLNLMPCNMYTVHAKIETLHNTQTSSRTELYKNIC